MWGFSHLILWIVCWLPPTFLWAQATWFGPTSIADAESRSKVSIVFASPDEISPLSYFGHTFLIFHRDELPEIDAPVVEFMGQTADLDHWAFQALFGSIPGRYQLQRYLYKAREYDFENRDLWVYTLQLSNEERRIIFDRLRTRLLEVHPYQFTSQNCGAYIESLLPFIQQPQQLYTLPMKTLQDPGVRSRVGSVRVMLSQRSQGRISQDPADVLRFRYAREPDRSKRIAIFNNLKSLPEPKPHVRTDDPADFSGRSRFGLQLSSTKNAHVLLSPYAQDFFTPRHELVPGSVLRILAADVELNSEAVVLDKLELFHMEAMTVDDEWTDGMVRHLEISWRQELDINDEAGWLLRWGGGYAWQPTPGLLLGVKGFIDLNLYLKPTAGIQPDTGGMFYVEHALGKSIRAALMYQQSVLPQYDRWARWNASLSHSFGKGIIGEMGANAKDWHIGLIQHF